MGAPTETIWETEPPEEASMLLRRTAVTLATFGLAIGLAATPAAAADNPGQNRLPFTTLECPDAGVQGFLPPLVLTRVLGSQGIGVGRTVEPGQGVFIPTFFELVTFNTLTGEPLFSGQAKAAPGHEGEGVYCEDIFSAPLSVVAFFSPEFADILRAAGAEETDIITFEYRFRFLFRGAAARLLP